MAKMKVQGVRPWDGEYELDVERAFNTREWNWVKKISGHGPLTFSEGFAQREPAVFVAMTVIAMCREGKIEREDGLRVADELAEAPFDFKSIVMVASDADEEAENDEVPLDSTPPPVELLQTGSGSSGG